MLLAALLLADGPGARAQERYLLQAQDSPPTTTSTTTSTETTPILGGSGTTSTSTTMTTMRQSSCEPLEWWIHAAIWDLEKAKKWWQQYKKTCKPTCCYSKCYCKGPKTHNKECPIEPHEPKKMPKMMKNKKEDVPAMSGVDDPPPSTDTQLTKEERKAQRQAQRQERAREERRQQRAQQQGVVRSSSSSRGGSPRYGVSGSRRKLLT